MKFGVLQFFSWPGRRGNLKDVYDRALERVHIMDQNGYDAVWIAEHHFSTYSVCPSIHMMGVQFAAHTQNLRIGTGVSLAAFYNPVRLAEEECKNALLSRCKKGVSQSRASVGETVLFRCTYCHGRFLYTQFGHINTQIGYFQGITRLKTHFNKFGYAL